MKKPSSPFIRTLQLAAETLGGLPQLAIHLGIDRAQLERWIAGADTPPNDVFIQALDVVAAGRLGMHRPADRAQAHADRMQAGADRAQKAADRAQRRADELNMDGRSAHFRQVEPKDGDAASNERASRDEKKKA